jgi:DNA primase
LDYQSGGVYLASLWEGAKRNMRIDKERLKAAIPIEQYYRGQLGKSRAGKYFCPFHNDCKTPNMVADEKGVKCFACNFGGDIFTFHGKLKGLSFHEVLKDLAREYAPEIFQETGNGNGSRQGVKTQHAIENARKAAQANWAVKKKKDSGYIVTGFYKYQCIKSGVINFRIRMDHPNPEEHEKWITPFSLINGEWKLKEPEFSYGKPLYIQEPDKDSNIFYIVEGEKKVDALGKLGLNAVTSGSATSAGKANWTELKGRIGMLWPDHDEPGQKYAQVVADKLLEFACQTRRIDVEKLNLPVGGDICDWVKINPKATKKEIGALATIEPDIFMEWSDPEQLEHSLHPVDLFPMEIIPESFKDWIKDVSQRMQCPPDFVTAAAIVLCGSLIGTKCGIKPKKNDDWLVIPNLWGGAVGRPSMLKTPSLAEALKPLGRLEAMAKESHDEALKEHHADLLEWEARKDALKNNMKKAASGKGTKTTEQIKDAFIKLEKPEFATMARYKSNDATIEKLSEILNENPNGLLLFRDELVGLLAGWEKPGRESDRAFFLEAWDGTGSHTTDRIGRGTIFTENVCLSLFGGIQPSKLTSYLLQMTGLENDGLIQRLQLLVYPDEVHNWRLVDEKPNRNARERAFNVIEKLATFDPTYIGAIQHDSDCFSSLRFCPESQEIFNEWLIDLEKNKLRADDSPLILEHLGKYRSLMPTLALIFHLIDVVDGATGKTISLQAAKSAVAFCGYLESHARRVYGLVGDIKQKSAAILAEKIKQGKLQGGFTYRDIYRQNWNLLNTKELAKAACNELIDAGWLKTEPQVKEGVGRPALPAHHINPKVKNI